MSKIDLTFVHLHNPLFLAGTNFGEKLDPSSSKGKGLKLTYDRAEKELVVEYKNQVALIPTSNIATMTVTNPADIGITLPGKPEPKRATHTPHPSKANISKTAQVADPVRDIVQGEVGRTRN